MGSHKEEKGIVKLGEKNGGDVLFFPITEVDSCFSVFHFSWWASSLETILILTLMWNLSRFTDFYVIQTMMVLR
jgi:hypothetical protein